MLRPDVGTCACNTVIVFVVCNLFLGLGCILLNARLRGAARQVDNDVRHIYKEAAAVFIVPQSPYV